MMIKNIVFDFGGVLTDLNRDRAVQYFIDMGLKNADQMLDKYHQKGIFLDVEDGSINAEEFCHKLSYLCNRKISFEEAQKGWLSFFTDVPQYKLDFLLELKREYKIYILSNTNPFIMGWARSSNFTPTGKPLDEYVHKIYTSFEIKSVKPDPAIFEYMIKDTSLEPRETLFVDDGAANIERGKEFGFHTLYPANGEDWRKELEMLLTNK